MYGPWWNLAPSGRTEINKESRKSFISEDFVGKVNIDFFQLFFNLLKSNLLVSFQFSGITQFVIRLLVLSVF